MLLRKPLRAKIQAKPLEQLPILRIPVQHPELKLQAQPLEQLPVLTTQVARLLAIQVRPAAQEPLVRLEQALPEIQVPLELPRILNVP
jgi:hypothetical protein